MAFPNDVPTFTQAVDPSSALDATNITTYQQYINSGDFVGAQTFLQQHTNLIAMNLTAGRYNEVLDLVNEMATFLSDADSGYGQFYNTNINAFTDISEWNNNTDYSAGQIVIYNNNVYSCLQDNGISTTVYEPTVTSGWDSYWKLLVQNQKQYPVVTSQPDNLNAGDIWFQDVTNS